MSGGGGSTTQTVQQNAEPWSAARPYLRQLLPHAQQLYGQRAFAPSSYENATGRSTLAAESPLIGLANRDMQANAFRDMNRGGTSVDAADAATRDIASGNLNAGQQGGMDAFSGVMGAGPVDATNAGPQIASLSDATNAAMTGLSGALGGQQTNTSLSPLQRAAYGGMFDTANADPQFAGRNAYTTMGMQGLSDPGGPVDTSRTGLQNMAYSDLRQASRYGTTHAANPYGRQFGQGLAGALSGQPTMSREEMSASLAGARQDALDSAIPAAVAQFAGAGMANSSQAMQEVGRAATQAVAPLEYAAAERTIDRDLSAREAAAGRQLQSAGLAGQIGESAAGRIQAGRDADAGRQMAGAQALGAFAGQDAGRGIAANESALARALSAAGTAGSLGQAQANRDQGVLDSTANRGLAAFQSLGGLTSTDTGRRIAASEAAQGRQLQGAGLAAQIGSGQEGRIQSALENDASRQFAGQESDLARQLAAGQGLAGLGTNMSQDQLRAAALAPQSYQSTYMPAQMLGQVGNQITTRDQMERDADVARYQHDASIPARNLSAYGGLLLGAGGQGGSSFQSQQLPGPSTAQRIGGAALGGLGTYGALAAGPAAPFAIPAAGLAGLLGLFG